MFNPNPMSQPFANLYRATAATAKTGFNWGSLLTNTQKTLSIVNQAIPIFYQVKPIWNNAKTMFKVMGELGKVNENRSSDGTTANSTNTTAIKTPEVNTNTNINTNQPNFFV